MLSVRALVARGWAPVPAVPIRIIAASATSTMSDRRGTASARAMLLYLVNATGPSVRVDARFAGDARFAPSEVSTRLRVVRPTRLTLRLGREREQPLRRIFWSRRRRPTAATTAARGKTKILPAVVA